MSCEKCCFSPCDRTSICMEGTYWVQDIYGNLTKMVEIPEALKQVISRAVEKALETEY